MGKHSEIFELCLIWHFYFPTKQAMQKFSRGRSVSEDQESLGTQSCLRCSGASASVALGDKIPSLGHHPTPAFALHCLAAGRSCKLHWFPFKSQQFPTAFPVPGGSSS